MEETRRNDVVTMAFLAFREGNASVAQQEKVYEACRNKAKFIARNYTDVIETEELLDALILKVWEKKDEFNPSLAGFSTWIEQLCMSVRSNLYGRYATVRKHTIQPSESDKEDEKVDAYKQNQLKDQSADSPERIILMEELCKEIRECLEEMSDNQKAAVEAIYFKGLKPGEASRVLNRKQGDLYNDHNRGLNNLRKKLEARGINQAVVLEILNER